MNAQEPRMRRKPVAVLRSLPRWLTVVALVGACSAPSGPSLPGGATTTGNGADNSGAGSSSTGTSVGGSSSGSGSGGASAGADAGTTNSSAGVPSSAAGQSPTGDAGAAGGAATGSGGAGTAGTGSAGTPETTEVYTAPATPPPDEDGSELWLRYPEVSIPGRLAEYQVAFQQVIDAGESPTLQVALNELVQGLSGLTGTAVVVDATPAAGSVVLGTPESSSVVASLSLDLTALGPAGYLVQAADVDGAPITVVAANTEVGVLYGSFALLRHLQSHRSLVNLSLTSAPKIERRILDHWDNLDGSIERGYAGRTLWDWDALPGTLSPRYADYARANASLGINGAVLTNINEDAQVLTSAYLDKVAALADVFRPYGIAVYLTARFTAPIEIGGLSTADPTDAGVQAWWADKAAEIYDKIPDFGGFRVKANSEGQPGPQDYGRTHAEGANMLADAVGPHGGIVLWRAFVYSEDSPVDRIRQAYEEFAPLDGQFADNVMIQVKNGPLDFQPREPFSPLFGAMPETPLALELQITKEYLGQDTHLAYLGPMYEEILKSDTFADGAGSTVARVIDGSLHSYAMTAIAGVANVGDDANWSGSHMNQANWYVFGRMAWDPDLTAAAVADEWVRQTFSNDPMLLTPVTEMLLGSYQALVDYMTPLGLAHIMGSDHHYGPAPWVDDLGRAEWNPVYYHRADAEGLGFDRTATGSNAVEQYFGAARDVFSDRATIPDDYLLFFHHVGWQETLGTGRTLWEELVHRYSSGVDAVGVMRNSWSSVEGRIDTQRFDEVADFLQIQHWEARWWRDACLEYFRTFANLDIPAGYAAPANALSYYQGLDCPSDVTKPRCDAINTGEPSPAVLP
jgi:alpha-glucuronidase